MHSLNYYAFHDDIGPLHSRKNSLNRCSRESVERPLIVNCAGEIDSMWAFKTDNVEGRLDYYLLYVVKGELILDVGGKDVVCTTGSFVLYPPKTRYIYRHSATGEIDYLWVHFTGSAVAQTLEKYGLMLYPHVNTIKHDDGITSRFTNLFTAFIKQDKFRDDELSLLLDRLLISLARRLSSDGENYLQLKTSVSYINAHYNHEIRIPELAKMENISVSRYNSVFKRLYGMSPVEYITKMRISSACELLGGTDLSVKEISLMTGYSDSHFFSRVFKAQTGISPSDYRKRQ
ncbi:MAG: helix-turn-helix transcriptional regulator [Clostridia bacterium]|nr:helix-turn-helix transcriptional regulator [Clostridia bacterium]